MKKGTLREAAKSPNIRMKPAPVLFFVKTRGLCDWSSCRHLCTKLKIAKIIANRTAFVKRLKKIFSHFFHIIGLADNFPGGSPAASAGTPRLRHHLSPRFPTDAPECTTGSANVFLCPVFARYPAESSAARFSPAIRQRAVPPACQPATGRHCFYFHII